MMIDNDDADADADSMFDVNIEDYCAMKLLYNHITSHHITSHHIKSNQIKSNQIKSNQAINPIEHLERNHPMSE